MTSNYVDIDYYGFHGFTDKLDITNPAACVKFSDRAKTWIDGLIRMCAEQFYMSRPEIFEVLVFFLLRLVILVLTCLSS